MTPCDKQVLWGLLAVSITFGALVHLILDRKIAIRGPVYPSWLLLYWQSAPVLSTCTLRKQRQSVRSLERNGCSMHAYISYTKQVFMRAHKATSSSRHTRRIGRPGQGIIEANRKVFVLFMVHSSVSTAIVHGKDRHENSTVQ